MSKACFRVCMTGDSCREGLVGMVCEESCFDVSCASCRGGSIVGYRGFDGKRVCLWPRVYKD